MENLTYRYHKVCILDLKMGSRQHGDDADEAKAKLQIDKCATTTSSSHGLYCKYS